MGILPGVAAPPLLSVPVVVPVVVPDVSLAGAVSGIPSILLSSDVKADVIALNIADIPDSPAETETGPPLDVDDDSLLYAPVCG